MFEESGRESITDKKISNNLKNEEVVNKLFLRLVAKEIRFENIDFRYTIFDRSYLRDCTFDSCNFTGCQFLNTNLYNSTFEGCNFQYAIFENTIVDPQILETSCPPYENLKLKFARTLRTNFGSIGNYEGVNKAIKIELTATEEHLKKSWKSNESYYRKKYQGFNRFQMFLSWFLFKIFGLIWGNGESIIKLTITTILFLIALGFIHVFQFGDPCQIASYWESFKSTPSIFFNTENSPGFSASGMAIIKFLRLILIGLFLSVIIKKLNRR